MNPCVCPTLIVVLEGLTVIDDSVGGGGPGLVTVNTDVLDVTDPITAVMLDVPAVSPVAGSGDPTGDATVAIVVLELFQAACKVQSAEVPSLKLQVAMYVWVDPINTDADAGAMVILVNVAAQVCVAVPLTLPKVA